MCVCKYKSRAVAYTGYSITSGVEEGDEGEKGVTFFTILPAHCASVAATLSQGPAGGYIYMFPSILVRSVWTKISSMLGQSDSPKRVGKIPLVGLLP